MAEIEIRLDICTPEGKTWLARITGPDSHYGVAREFLRAVSRDTSKSGKTGVADYLIGPGIYERHEGRNRLRNNNGFFQVGDDGEITPFASAREALAALTVSTS